jgi:glycosyltransferase involved in cell wall biosynthesis
VTVLFPELRSLRKWRPGAGSGERIDAAEGEIREWRWHGFRWWPRERHGTIAFTSAARRLMADYVSERGGPPDLIHAHVVMPAGYAAWRLSGVWDVPFVLTEHAGPFDMMMQSAWQRRCVRRAVEGAAAVVAVSPALVEAMRRAGVRREMEVVPNTIDPSFTSEVAGTENAPTLTPTLSLEGKGRIVRFLTVASMRAGKGVDDLIRAFARTADQHREATLTIAGEGPLEGELCQLSESLGVAERVRFVGPLAGPAEVRRAVLNADVFALASHAETFGVALIEALACGRPVIATRCGGPESIVTAANGLLVAVADVTELAEAMDTMARRLSEYEPAAIRADALARFGPDVIARRYEQIYDRVLSAHAAASAERGAG